MKTFAHATSDKSSDTCGLNSVAILDAFDSRHQLGIWQHPGSGLRGGNGGKDGVEKIFKWIPQAAVFDLFSIQYSAAFRTAQ
jgi:hypothetical protein